MPPQGEKKSYGSVVMGTAPRTAATTQTVAEQHSSYQQHDEEDALLALSVTKEQQQSHQTSASSQTTANKPHDKSTYDLSLAFRLMSGTVWASMSLWGVWISVYYGKSALCFDWDAFNIAFPDMHKTGYNVAFVSIAVHLIGAAYMALAGAFQLVKYVRKRYIVVHKWVGRLYIVASLVTSLGGLGLIFFRGSSGGRPADYAFATYGFIFLISGILTYYYVKQKDISRHKLWAWRLYSLSLAGWMYRADYYWWMVSFGIGEDSWLHNESFQGAIDYWINWAFYVPNLLVVEIVYRWGENTTLPTFWSRVLDVSYYVVFVMTAIFTIHAFMQLWMPSILGFYQSGWII